MMSLPYRTYAALLLLTVLSSGCVRQNWKKASLYLQGPCESCPATRVADAFQGYKGIYEVKVDSDSRRVTVVYDGALVKEADIIAQLNEFGYGTADYPSIIQSHIAGCCSMDADDMAAAQRLGGADTQVDDDAREMEQILNVDGQMQDPFGASLLAQSHPIATYHQDLEPFEEIELLTNPDYNALIVTSGAAPTPLDPISPAAKDDEIYHELFDLTRF